MDKYGAIAIIAIAGSAAAMIGFLAYGENNKHDAAAKHPCCVQLKASTDSIARFNERATEIIKYNDSIISRGTREYKRMEQQLQDCKEDLLRQDTIIMDQRSYIEQFEGLKKARPPNR